MSSKEKLTIAKRERDRLRLQAKMKKEQLEKMQSQQNDDSALGEVRQRPCRTWASLAVIVL